MQKIITLSLIDSFFTQPSHEFQDYISGRMSVGKYITFCGSALAISDLLLPEKKRGNLSAYSAICLALLEYRNYKFLPHDWNQRSMVWVYPIIYRRNNIPRNVIILQLSSQMIQSLLWKKRNGMMEWLSGDTLAGALFELGNPVSKKFISYRKLNKLLSYIVVSSQAIYPVLSYNKKYRNTGQLISILFHLSTAASIGISFRHRIFYLLASLSKRENIKIQ